MPFEVPIFGIAFALLTLIIGVLSSGDYSTIDDPSAPMKPLKRPPPKPIFERLAAMEALNLKLQRSPNGKIYATGEVQGHHLAIEALGPDDDPLIKLTVTASRSLILQKQQTPTRTIADIAQVLAPGNPAVHGMIRGVVKVDHPGNALTYQQPNSEFDLEVLENALNFTAGVVDAYSDMIALGGEVVPTLLAATENRPFMRPFVIQVLRDIGTDTRNRLRVRASRLVCPACLTRFNYHKVELPGRFVGITTYYGCRRCGQSREFLVGNLVAVLDEAVTKPIETGIGSVRVAWLAYKQPFDFDRVEIKQVSDEAVERFAMQVGNDTDEWRRGNYAQMQCTVLSACKISENTMRILARTFGEVVVNQKTSS